MQWHSGVWIVVWHYDFGVSVETRHIVCSCVGSLSCAIFFVLIKARRRYCTHIDGGTQFCGGSKGSHQVHVGSNVGGYVFGDRKSLLCCLYLLWEWILAP